MEDLVEISSDSNDTVILPSKTASEDIDDILQMYSSENVKTGSNSSSQKHLYNLSDFSDNEIESEPLFKRLKTNTDQILARNNSWQDKFSVDDFCENSNELPDILTKVTNNSSKVVETQEKYDNNPLESCSDEDLLQKLYSKYLPSKSSKSSISDSEKDVSRVAREKKKGKSTVDKEQHKLEKEQAKLARLKERETKKQEAEREKAKKNALKVVEKSVKPDKCIEYVTVNLDNNILNKEYGQIIQASLKNSCYNFKFMQQRIPNFISWTRKVQTIENLFLQNTDQNEKHFLYIMDIKDIIEHIHNNTFIAHIQSILSLPEVTQLYLTIFGLGKYYKYLINDKNNEFHAAVSENPKKNCKDHFVFKDLPKISRKDIEMALTELQIMCKCCFRPVEKSEELTQFIMECTKSVAQIPYKLMKQQRHQQEAEYFSGDNKDCVRVDKDGNGLGRLWNQILTMFPMARLEHAEAITSVYPTLDSLFKAYKNCETVEEGERLLQNIPIRRAAGPLSSVRKIGQEMSKKVYYFFWSDENVLL